MFFFFKKSSLTSLHKDAQLFRQQRLMHREALKSIVGLNTYEKQHQMMSLVLDKLFKVSSFRTKETFDGHWNDHSAINPLVIQEFFTSNIVRMFTYS